MVVDVDPRLLEARDRHVRRWQWSQCRLVQRLERAGAAAGQLLERARVEFSEKCANGDVEVGQAEKKPIAQARQNPALYHLYPHFYFGLVAGMRRTCR